MEARNESLSRRDVLRQTVAVAAISLVPGLARAEFNEKIRGTLEQPKHKLFESLAKPQLATVHPEVLAAYSELAGFEVRAMTIPLHNRLSGETVELLYGENGEFAWHWTIKPGGKVPFMHNHVDEEEVIHLIQGSISCYLHNKKDPVTATVVDQPIDFVIPKNTYHQPFNQGTEDVVGMVRFENPEEAQLLSTIYWNMVHAGLTDKHHGKPNFMMLLRKTAALDDRTHIRGIPPAIQDLAHKMARFFGGITEADLLEEFESAVR